MSANLMSLAQSGGKFLKLYGDRKMVWTLPYLRRVAYLESHGKEWIDTGVLSSSELEVAVDFVCNKGFVFGTYIQPYQFGCDTDSPGYWRIDGYGGRPSSNISKGVRHVIVLRNGPSTLDGDVVLNIDSSFFDKGSRVLLFKADTQGGLIGMVYSCSISKNGKKLRSYIPVLDPSGRPAMYDEVSGQFFYNQGMGEFTWGELDSQTT